MPSFRLKKPTSKNVVDTTFKRILWSTLSMPLKGLLQIKKYTISVISGSFHVKSTKFQTISHLTLMDFVQILSHECIHQKMKILKILSLYPVWFRNYDHLKYGPFDLDTKPLKFLSFWNWFYSAIFNRKHLKFGLVNHFHEIIPKTMYLAKNFIRHFCGKQLKFSKLMLSCFSFHFQRAISWQGKI